MRSGETLSKAKQIFGLDLRSLALFRIGLAIVILVDLAFRFQDISSLYSDVGVLPRDALIAEKIRHPLYWSLHLISGQPFFQVLLFLFAALMAVAMLVGYRTRLATIASWAMIISIHNRNPVLLFAADDVLRALMFWAMFLPLGAVYSLDSALNSNPKPLPKNILTSATVALIVQQCFIYMFSVVFKASSPLWFPEGTAVYYAFSFDQYATPVSQFLLNFPPLLTFSSYFTLIIEFFGPLFLFIPFYTTFFRFATVITFILLHVTFDLGFELGIFPLLSVASWFAFIPTPIWDYLEKKIQTEPRKGLTIYYDADCGFCKKIVHILRTLLVLPQTPIIQAQEDDSIYADMQQYNSWVVLDWQGNRRFKWEAMIYVISLSPIFKFIVPIMKWQPLMAAGTKLYETIANNRRLAGNFTKPFKFRPLKVEKSPLINIIAGLLLLATFFWNIRTFARQQYTRKKLDDSHAIAKTHHLFNRRTVKRVDWISRITRLDQGWSIFAPAPPRDDGWHVIQGKLQDGTEVDLLNNKKANVSWDKPTLKQRNQLYPNMQWRSYYINLSRSIGQKLYPYYGQYLCRTWNSKHQGKEQLDSLEIYFMDERTVPPGEVQGVEKKSHWQQSCGEDGGDK